MLEGLKRLFAGGEPPRRDWSELSAWASERGCQLGRVREVDGFVIEGQLQGHAWRAEWGPAQRNYIEGNELRLRAEMPARGDVQALLLTRALQVDMEAKVFDQIVEDVQTQIDDKTPPEMRWLVMHPKLQAQDMGPLGDRFVAVGPARSWLKQWLTPAFTQALLQAPSAADQPLALMIVRGRMTLRTPVQIPAPATLAPWVALFDVALRSLPEASAAAPSSGLGVDPDSALGAGPTTR